MGCLLFLLAVSVGSIVYRSIIDYGTVSVAQAVQESLNISPSSIDKIGIQSGATFKKASVTGTRNIHAFFHQFSDVRLKKVGEQGPSVGYSLAVGFYKSGKYIGGFTYNGPVLLIHISTSQDICYKTNQKYEYYKIARLYHLDK